MQKVIKASRSSIILAIQSQWLLRSPRERRLLSVTTVVILISLYAWFLVSTQHKTAVLRGSLPALRMQAITLEQQAREFEQLQLLPAPPSSDGKLMPMIQEMAQIAGLAELLSTIEALDSHRVAVAFGTVPFPVWIEWIHALSAQGIRIEHIEMETLLTPGLVGTRATLMRTGTP